MDYEAAHPLMPCLMAIFLNSTNGMLVNKCEFATRHCRVIKYYQITFLLMVMIFMASLLTYPAMVVIFA